MPYIRVWIHFVWSTKERLPLLSKEARIKLFDHIRSNAKEKKIHLDRVNGHAEHVHAVISLGSDQTISKVSQLLKGESSLWLKRENLVNQDFAWQDDYFAVSVSESAIDEVRKYIDNQEEHHRVKTFQEEYQQFMRRYGFAG